MEDAEKFAVRNRRLQQLIDQFDGHMRTLTQRLSLTAPEGRYLLWFRRGLSLAMVGTAILAIKYMVAHYASDSIEEWHLYQFLKAHVVLLVGLMLWFVSMGIAPRPTQELRPSSHLRLFGVPFDAATFQVTLCILGAWWMLRGDDSVAIAAVTLALAMAGLLFWLGAQGWALVGGVASLLLLLKLLSAAARVGQAELEHAIENLEHALADMKHGYLTASPYVVLFVISMSFTPLRRIRLGKRSFGSLLGDFTVPFIGGRRVHLCFASALIFGAVALGVETFIRLLLQLPDLI